MPTLKEFVARGGCREDLVMLGGMPTITPPMRTTLSTGAQASTHGITGFWNVDPNDRSKVVYALDSTICKAEQVWNCLVEAGNKVLVWHCPGSSWPPTSESPNLAVVDGAQPGFIGFDPMPVMAMMLISIHIAYLTPAASPFASLMFGFSNWIKPADIYKMGTVVAVMIVLVFLAVGIPLSNIFLKSIVPAEIRK